MEKPDYTHPLEIFTEWNADWYANLGQAPLSTARRDDSREATPQQIRNTFVELLSACKKEKGQCPH